MIGSAVLAVDTELMPVLPLLSSMWSAVNSIQTMWDDVMSKESLAGTTTIYEEIDKIKDKKWPDNFDFHLADSMYSFTAASYCSMNGLANLNCGTVCDRIAPMVTKDGIAVITSAHTETQVLVVKDHLHELVVVIPRGTTPWDMSYWLIDLGAFPQRIPDYCDTCFVHTAFYAALQPAREKVYEFATKWATDSGWPVAVSGHSAGGASAYLMAFDLGYGINLPPDADKEQHVRYVFTFGAPRMGNAAFVEKLAMQVGAKNGYSEAWRVVKGNDPIPASVPSFLGYVHAFPEVHLREQRGVYKICRPPDTKAFLIKEDPSCSQLSFSFFNADLSHHEDYFLQDQISDWLQCGQINEENAFYNSTVALAITGGLERSIRSWLPF